MTSSQLWSPGIPPEGLHTMRRFYDFDSAAAAVEWEESIDTGGDVTQSSGSGTGSVRLTTGTTENTGISINTAYAAGLTQADYILDGAQRMAMIATGDSKLAYAVGWGYSFSKDFIADGGTISWASKEFYGLVKKPDDDNLWAVVSSYNGGTWNEVRTSWGAGDESEPRMKNGYGTYRVTANRIRGNIIIVKFSIDPQGNGAFETVTTDRGKPADLRLDGSNVTSVNWGLAMKNTTTNNQRIWVDWWSQAARRQPLSTLDNLP